MFYVDWTYIALVLPALAFSLWASSRVNSTFRTYSGQHIRCGLTGAEAARMILDANGLYQVRIERVTGNLTDHYDPRSNVIRLSDNVFSSATTAAVGVAAHECGHAIQHATGYLPIKIRSAIVPLTNLGSKIAMPLIILGIIFSYTSAYFISIAYLGVICYSLCALFQLVTLPTEYNASRRAIGVLEGSGRLYGDEIAGAKKVLSAAALTYVAALAVSLTQLFRLLLRVRRNDRRR